MNFMICFVFSVIFLIKVSNQSSKLNVTDVTSAQKQFLLFLSTVHYDSKTTSATYKPNSCLAKLGLGASLGVGIMNAGTALSWFGFTSSGVAAGSWAALWQSSIGNVVTGSAFATLQSYGASAVTASLGSVGVGIVAPIAVAGGIYCYYCGQESDICPQFIKKQNLL
jgi:hypothetical protein